jgi:hypothetical protein
LAQINVLAGKIQKSCGDFVTLAARCIEALDRILHEIEE